MPVSGSGARGVGRLIRDLQQRVRAAEASASHRSLMLASMSHEIREPLNGVLGMARLLHDTPLDEEQKSYAAAVLDSGQALLTIINDMLDLSKLEAGQLQLVETDFDLERLVDRLVLTMRPRARAKCLSLEVRLAADVPGLVRGDPGRLRQVLANLLGNALKFTERGGISLTVDLIESTPQLVDLAFMVQDSGIGISPAARELLFRPFAQASVAIQRRYGGTGLGLMICRRILDLMGGEIEIDSTEGVGTIVTFHVPFARATSTPRANYGAVFALAEVDAIIADPSAAVRRRLRGMCEDWGMHVCEAATASDALSALEVAARQPLTPTVVLVDRAIPDIGGEALGRRIRQNDAFGAVRLVMLSDSGLRGDAALAAAAGFDAYLSQPVNKETLRRCLVEVLRGSREHAAHRLITSHAIDEARAQPLRILVADDNPVNSRLVSILLEKAGHRIDVAPDGCKAVDAMRAGAYDLVLMDVQMPQMDGFEACRAIREMTEPACKVPVIGLTANAMEGDRERCLAAGMDDYLPKPVDPARLVQAISAWTGRISRTP